MLIISRAFIALLLLIGAARADGIGNYANGAGSGTVSDCSTAGGIGYFSSTGTTIGCSTGITASNTALTLGSGVELTYGSGVVASSPSALGGETLFANNSASVNSLAFGNLNVTGFSAATALSIDQTFPSTNLIPTGTYAGMYEHLAIGFGQGLGLGGQTGVDYIEFSRYDGASNAAIPPPISVIQTTGGIDPTGGIFMSGCTLTNTSASITCPANSTTNGQQLSGTGIVPGTTISSGGGTTSITMSAPATAGGTVNVLATSPQYAQYDRLVIGNNQEPGDYNNGIGIFSFSGGKGSLSAAPFAYFDEAHSRTYFGLGGIADKLTYGLAPINIVDPSNPILTSVKDGVNNLQLAWAATPARVTLTDGNASAVVQAWYMDSTERVNFPAAGSASAPTLSVGNLTTGFYSVSTTGVGVSVNGSDVADYGITTAGDWTFLATARFPSGLNITAGNNLNLNGTGTPLSSPSNNTFQIGTADGASPAAQTIQAQSVVAGTSNTAGANLIIQGSRGTGTGPSGNVLIQVGKTGSTGSTQNTAYPLISANAGNATGATVQFGDGTNFTTYDSCTALTTGATGIIACTASASRFKNILAPITPDEADAGLNLLRVGAPVWEYKNEYKERFGNGHRVGLIADDVARMNPDCVVTDAEGTKDYWDRCVIAYLVADRQKMKAEIEKLERRVH